MPVLSVLLLDGADAHLPECSIQLKQKVEYPSPHDPEKNIKKFKAVAKTSPVPFVLYADFEDFLVPREENKESTSNTKVRQLHKSSGFACLRVSTVSEFNGNIYIQRRRFDDCLFIEHIKDLDRYLWSILSELKPIKTLTAEKQLQHVAATTCEL